MANLITLSRLLLLIVVVTMIYNAPAEWVFVTTALLILMFVSDAYDGHVARKRNEASEFGALFDIASDRIVELSLWIVLFDVGHVPLWVVLLFIFRGGIVDAIRSAQAVSQRKAPFETLQSPLGRRLVAGKVARVGYAVIKAVTFCWLVLIHSLPELIPAFWTEWGASMTLFGDAMIYSAALICLARGLPVIVEFINQQAAENRQ